MILIAFSSIFCLLCNQQGFFSHSSCSSCSSSVYKFLLGEFWILNFGFEFEGVKLGILLD
jgi:hypothetical protein